MVLTREDGVLEPRPTRPHEILEFGEDGSPSSGPDDRRIRRVWQKMRQQKPHLYVVLRPWVEAFQLRDTDTQYSSRVYRGFYAELSRKLGVTENGVKYRLRSAIKWFARHVESGKR